MIGTRRRNRPYYVDPIPQRGTKAVDSNYIVQTQRGRAPYIVRHGKLRAARQDEYGSSVYLTADEAQEIFDQPRSVDVVDAIEKILERR